MNHKIKGMTSYVRTDGTRLWWGRATINCERINFEKHPCPLIAQMIYQREIKKLKIEKTCQNCKQKFQIQLKTGLSFKYCETCRIEKRKNKTNRRKKPTHNKKRNSSLYMNSNRRIRNCLRCGHDFFSEWEGNRVCSKCSAHEPVRQY